MASKIILEEKEGDLVISGVISGNLNSILGFADTSINAILEEVYNAAASCQPKPGIDREAASVSCAIRVMKNAFNTFAEEHAGAFEKAIAYEDEFEYMPKTKKGGLVMYTGALTLCALIALFSFAAIICEKVLDKLVFEPMEEDWSNLGEE